jgi:hypothetical protein
MALDDEELASIAHAIAQRGPTVSLDEVGDALGARAILVTDVERLLFALDLRGVKVNDVDDTRAVPECLAAVLATARQLRHVHGRVPTVSEIAEHAALPERTVRMALLFAQVMSRS